MALTKIGTDGVKDDAVTSDKVANSINTAIAANTAKTQTTINNNADNRVITGSGTANTLNGESSVVIDANGKLGIGTASPAEILHIKEGTDKNVHFTGGIGQIGNITGLYAVNDANNAIVDIGIAGTTVRVGTTAGERARFTGDGLCFNGDTAAANALDDYEEGTFTPAFKATGASNNSDTSVQESRYIKIGGLVFVSFFIDMNAHGNSTGGYANITGLPFTSSGRHYPVTIGYYSNLLQNQTIFTGTIQPSSNLILLRHCTGACSATSGLDYSNAIGTSTEMIVSAVYSIV